MVVVAIWVTQMMLHVADDRILPVANVNRSIRSDIDRYWPEVRIAGAEEIRQPLPFEARAILGDFDPVNALETNDIAVEKIPLEFGREMAAGEQSGAGARTRGALPE